MQQPPKSPQDIGSVRAIRPIELIFYKGHKNLSAKSTVTKFRKVSDFADVMEQLCCSKQKNF
jgi:hypothetical protein